MKRREFPDFKEMFEEMCHQYYESCAVDVNSERSQQIMKDVIEFKRLVQDYMGVKMEGRTFYKYES